MALLYHTYSNVDIFQEGFVWKQWGRKYGYLVVAHCLGALVGKFLQQALPNLTA